MHPKSRFLVSLLAVAFLAACASPPDKLVLEPAQYSSTTGWAADNQAEALAAFMKSCGGFAKLSDSAATGQGMLLSPVSVWKDICGKAALIPPEDNALARQFFEDNFVPFHVSNNQNPIGLFTGYYEPLLRGSRTQKRPFVYPVYGLPEAGTPSFSREQIDLGALKDKAPVLAYADDAVELFFLHIQGSGRIELDDGTTLRVGYAGGNGMKYVSIGKVLADKGVMKKEDITMPRLRQWLYDHPDERFKVMWENPSYEFFREMEGDPVGSQQVPLTAGRSIAVDPRFLPPGSPVFLDTVLPATPLSPMAIHRRLYIAQDSGAAIRGPSRADIFFGFGTAAEQLAGQMKAGGTMTLLIPRELAIALQAPQ